MITQFKAQELIHQRLVILVIVGVMLFMATSLFYQSRIIINYSDTSDFSAYYAAYIVKREKGSGIYERKNFYGTNHYEHMDSGVREYLYPPLMAETLSTFMPSNYIHARLLWITIEHGFLFLLFAISMALASSTVRSPLLYISVVATLVIVSFSAIERSFFYGQASLIMVTMIYAAVWLKIMGRCYLAAFVAALATLVKIYPIVYLPALLLKGRYLESGVYLASVFLIAALFMAIFGTHDWITFFQFQGENPLVDREGASSGDITALYEVPNYSPSALLFLLNDQLRLPFTGLELWRFTKVTIFIFASAIICIRFKVIANNTSFLDLIILGFIGIMLVSPLLWNHVFIILVPAYTVYLCQLYLDKNRSHKDILLITLSFILVSFPDLFVNVPFTNNGWLVLLKFTKLYGVLIMAYIVFKRCNIFQNNGFVNNSLKAR